MALSKPWLQTSRLNCLTVVAQSQIVSSNFHDQPRLKLRIEVVRRVAPGVAHHPRASDVHVHTVVRVPVDPKLHRLAHHVFEVGCVATEVTRGEAAL